MFRSRFAPTPLPVDPAAEASRRERARQLPTLSPALNAVPLETALEVVAPQCPTLERLNEFWEAQDVFEELRKIKEREAEILARDAEKRAAVARELEIRALQQRLLEAIPFPPEPYRPLALRAGSPPHTVEAMAVWRAWKATCDTLKAQAKAEAERLYAAQTAPAPAPQPVRQRSRFR